VIRVLIFNEFLHENRMENVKEIYPDGMHAVLAEMLNGEEDISAECVTLFNAEGQQNDLDALITEEKLRETDVLLWWGHCAHQLVPDSVVNRVQRAVLGGMGAIFLHSAHHSKPFRALMGTTCNLSWREDGDLCRLWVVDPSHPVTRGLGKYFEIPHDEMYGEPFGIPEPDKLLLLTWFEGGEVFRSCCAWRRGAGKVIYFQPGHETYPVYYLPEVRTVIKNAVRWTAPEGYRDFVLDCPNVRKPGAE